MGWTLAFSALWRVFRGVSGSAVRDTADRLAGLLTDLQDAKTEERKAEIEREIVQIKAVHDLQKPQATRWWSPMQIGQYLIVIPFGLWWAAVCLVSVIRPILQEGRWSVDNIPPHIFEMAWWLIPGVILGTVLDRRR